MMWAAGTLAAMSSLSYPAISAFISFNADSDKQGKLTVFKQVLLCRINLLEIDIIVYSLCCSL